MLLRMSMPAADKLLKTQIAKGKALQEELSKCVSPESLEKIKNQYRNWSSFNGDALLKIFPSDSEKKEYEGICFGAVYFGEESLSQKIQKINKDIEAFES